MMRGTQMAPCDKQLTAQYIGATGAPGGFVDTLEATAAFLVSRDRLPEAPAREIFEDFMHPEYLEAVVTE